MSKKSAERFGLRRVEWVEHGPFKLNGQRLLLRGTHYHEDHAGVAAAVPDEVVRQTLTMIKQMGANFVRLGHYQQAPLVLDLCDELGLLAWEEIPWCRGGLGGQHYRRQCREMLAAMIDQHYSHPSIILWGLGNENDWPGDFETFDKQEIHSFMTELNSLAHRLDPSRPTTIRRCDFCKDITDVYSPSIWAGWYSGRYSEYRAAVEKAINDTPHFFHAEWGADSHARRFSEEPEKMIAQVATGQGTAEKGKAYKLKGGKVRISKDGDWSESYAVNLFDWHLKEQEQMEQLSGAAQWIFKDFATPLRPENPVPRVNQKGLVERDGTPKEGYYVFQSYWSETPDGSSFRPHLAGAVGSGGRSQGGPRILELPRGRVVRQRRFRKRETARQQELPRGRIALVGAIQQGQEHLRAVGHRDGAEVSDELTVAYQTRQWGKPAKLTLSEIAQKDGIATMEVRILDKDDVECLDGAQVVRFGLAGEGRLLDNLGTSTGSRLYICTTAGHKSACNWSGTRSA